MAEVTPGRGRAEKEIRLFEDFESITHHALLGGISGTDIRRSANAAHTGHAGLQMFTPADASAFAEASWLIGASKQPLLKISFWCKIPFRPASGSFHIFAIIQKRSETHELGIRYNFGTQSWEFYGESRAWAALPEVTSKLGEGIWTRIAIEVNTNTSRVTAVHVNEDSFRFNRAYARMAIANEITYMNIRIRLNGSATSSITFYVDDLMVQEL
jgi:hypothetical protein